MSNTLAFQASLESASKLKLEPGQVERKLEDEFNDYNLDEEDEGDDPGWNPVNTNRTPTSSEQRLSRKKIAQDASAAKKKKNDLEIVKNTSLITADNEAREKHTHTAHTAHSLHVLYIAHDTMYHTHYTKHT